MEDLAVCYTEENSRKKAEDLAQKLGVPLLDGDPSEEQLVLSFDREGLSLRRGELALRGDFSGMKRRLRQPNLNSELLVKAARIRNAEGTPTAVDATAGLGEDSLLLAGAGFSVLLCERDPVIAALLQDAMERAAGDPALGDAAGRMRLVVQDSEEVLRNLSSPPDVVYLDPMFPKREKSGLVKKKFQLLHHLETPCSEEDARALLLSALSARPRRTVIKRPKKGPYLADRKPSFSLEGKAIRYDVLLRQD